MKIPAWVFALAGAIALWVAPSNPHRHYRHFAYATVLFGVALYVRRRK